MPEPASSGPELLRVEELHAWYGESHILHGMSFAVAEGEVVTLLGRNGAGKTTTLRAIMGIVPQRQGSVVFRGSEVSRFASNRIARLGIASKILAPQVKPRPKCWPGFLGAVAAKPCRAIPCQDTSCAATPCRRQSIRR